MHTEFSAFFFLFLSNLNFLKYNLRTVTFFKFLKFNVKNQHDLVSFVYSIQYKMRNRKLDHMSIQPKLLSPNSVTEDVCFTALTYKHNPKCSYLIFVWITSRHDHAD